MSRRLRKKIRAGKHSNRSAANLPKLNFSELGVARKRSLRAALMVGTALTTGTVGVVGEVVVGGSPAMAGTCTLVGTTETCTGLFPTVSNLGPFYAPGVYTVNVHDATVGGNKNG